MGKGTNGKLRDLLVHGFAVFGYYVALAVIVVGFAIVNDYHKDQNTAYHDQLHARTALSQQETPAAKRAASEHMLLGVGMVHGEPSLDDKNRAMLKHVAATGEVPPQSNRWHPLGDMKRPVLIVAYIAFVIICIAWMLGLADDAGRDRVHLIEHLPRRRWSTWAFYTVTTLAVFPLIVYAVSLRNARKNKQVGATVPAPS